MTRFKVLGRFGTLCGVLAMLALTTGCPFLDPCRNVTCDDDDPCTSNGCSGGECQYTAIEDCCETAADCNDNNACTIDACSDIDADTGAGDCTNTAVGQNCCNDSDDCDAGEVCNGNQCGAPCDSNDDCDAGEECDTTTGECEPISGGCTNNAQCNDGDACTTDTCTNGACSNADIVCDTGEVCVGGVCVPTCEEDVDCLDDANECTEVACVDGACVTTTEDCDDGAACTTDSCDPATGVCTNEDNCVTGTCNTTTGECSGCVADVDCDDNDDCTDDACVDGACENTDNTAPCSDGDACTTGDVCAAGVCAGTAVVCPPGQQCDAGTGNCDDILCDNNADCNDGFSCTTDTCNVGTGACVYTEIDDACEDNLHCTGPLGTDNCNPDDPDAEAGTGCVRVGNPCGGFTPICQESNDSCIACTNNAQCDDGFSCTSDTCAGSGACTNTEVDSQCPDPLKCDGDDQCEPGDPDADQTTGCIAPGNPCAPRVCNEATFVVGDNNTCEDCTSNASCTDGIACTEDICNGGTGECASAPNDALCPDPLFCNGEDICIPGHPDAGADGCINPLPFGAPCGNACNEATNTCFDCTGNLDCSDGIACTDDLCNGVTGACTHNDNCAVGSCNFNTGQCD